MTDRFRHVIALLFILSLVAAVVAPLPARAQDDGTTLVFDQPLILTLAAGQSATRTFDVAAGDGFVLRLDRLTDFAYTAVLIDPNQSAIPLIPDANGSSSYTVDSAPTGGRYTLVLQAAAGGGDLLIQLTGGAAPPAPLALGETIVTVEAAAQRFSLAPVPDVLFTSLSVETIVPEGVPGLSLPALKLVNETTGETILDLAPSILVLPAIAVMLPADGAFRLAIEPGEDTLQVLITWEAIPIESTPAPPPAQPPSSGSSGAPPAASGACVVAFAGNVNVRYGPGLAYQPPIGVAQAGTTLPVTGKNEDGSWWQVLYNGGPGWVSAQVAATSTQGDCSGVPVASYPAVGDTSALTPSASGSVTPTYTPGGPTVTPTYTPSPTYTPGGPTVTPTWTYTPSYTPTVTWTPTWTYTPGGPTLTPTWTYTPSYTPTATWTNTPSYTPTATWTPAQEQQLVLPTATHTYTPSYTPTTPPPPPTAPPDANFNSPLNIPLDSTASTTDFVSYPGGDTEDRVRWDIIGMNPNVSLSGGRARLIISASCFGTGTQNIQFFTGGQTFSCGQTIVDREVTYDSRTGQVTITAVAGANTYVQWVLTGTATRLN